MNLKKSKIIFDTIKKDFAKKEMLANTNVEFKERDKLGLTSNFENKFKARGLNNLQNKDNTRISSLRFHLSSRLDFKIRLRGGNKKLYEEAEKKGVISKETAEKLKTKTEEVNKERLEKARESLKEKQNFDKTTLQEIKEQQELYEQLREDFAGNELGEQIIENLEIIREIDVEIDGIIQDINQPLANITDDTIKIWEKKLEGLEPKVVEAVAGGGASSGGGWNESFKAEVVGEWEDYFSTDEFNQWAHGNLFYDDMVNILITQNYDEEEAENIVSTLAKRHNIGW